MPTHREFPWERDERNRRPRRQPAPVYASPPPTLASKRRRRRPGSQTVAKGLRSILLLAALAATIGLRFGAFDNLGGFGNVVSHTLHRGTAGNYRAVPGPWRWRWVPVQNPPPGSPPYIRQRYRTIHYVSVP